jgi:putative ABC transport system permease protein
MIIDYLIMALRNLRKRRLRTWLTVLGIFIAVATIFILISLSLGLQNAVTEQFRTLGSDKIIIMPKGLAGVPGSGGAVELTIKDVGAVKKVSGVKDVAYFTINNVKIEFNSQQRYYLAIGVPLDDLKVYQTVIEASGLKIDEGRFIEKEDSFDIMIGSQYKTVFSKPVKVGDKIKLNGHDFNVVGILKTIGNPSDDQSIYLPFKTAQEFFSTNDRVDEIFIQIDAGSNITSVADKVEVKLRKFRGVTEKTQDFSILTPEELLSSIGTILNIITAFLAGIAAISLIVGGIGIANTMYTSVLERTREIGTLKAIGAKNKDILTIFLIESGLLGLVGGIIGVIIGIAIGELTGYIAVVYLATNLLRPAFPAYLIIGSLLFSFLIGSASGFFPALQAAKLRPVEALRYE